MTPARQISQSDQGIANFVPELKKGNSPFAFCLFPLTLKLGRLALRMVAGGERQFDQMADPHAQRQRLGVHPVQARADRTAALRAVGVATEEARFDARLQIGGVIHRDARKRTLARIGGRM